MDVHVDMLDSDVLQVVCLSSSETPLPESAGFQEIQLNFPTRVHPQKQESPAASACSLPGKNKAILPVTEPILSQQGGPNSMDISTKKADQPELNSDGFSWLNRVCPIKAKRGSWAFSTHRAKIASQPWVCLANNGIVFFAASKLESEQEK